MNFLVDTNVISALAPTKRQGADDLVAWMDRASPYLFLSVVSAAEIRAGISKAEREGATTKVSRLMDWWNGVEYLYSARILPFDLQCAHAAGQLMDRVRAHEPGFEDIAIAATARVNGLTILTRNMRHFVPLGVEAINPFETLPALP